MSEKPNILIIGTGKVARHFIQFFQRSDIAIEGIMGRNKPALLELSKNYALPIREDFHDLHRTTLVLICVSDKAVVEVAQTIPAQLEGAYTSGSVPLSALSQDNIGVFYPLQTFTHGVELDSQSIPFLIEAKRIDLEERLVELAKKISSKVELADSNKRFQLHIAAVMANNFVNHLFALSKQHLDKQHIDFSLLQPLIEETVRKIKHHEPYDCQTGPAVREDHETLTKHLSTLDGLTKEFYELFTRSIQQLHQTK
jgi:predicted short-subunit dehydrogenase-like oxidoreductase (DUF2520 family)